MAKEYIFYCNTHGKINDKNVMWVTLSQGVDASVCPYCKVEITKVQVNKGQTPRLKPGVWRGKKDLFDKYGGAK